jgi:transcriptional regulator with XRE-family HTH domain
VAVLMARWMEVVDHELSAAETTAGYVRRTINPALGEWTLRKLQHRVDLLDRLYKHLGRCNVLCGDRSATAVNYSNRCYGSAMSDRGDLLREVMLVAGITQSELSRISGVRQPSISQFLSSKVELSDEQLDRLLSCMGYRLEVVRRPIEPDLTRSERRSWRLHRRLSSRLTRTSLEVWRPTIERNLERLRGRVTGQPHQRNLERWTTLVESGDVLGLHRVLTGLDRDSIEMREVSPMGGLLSQDERAAVLAMAG